MTRLEARLAQLDDLLASGEGDPTWHWACERAALAGIWDQDHPCAAYQLGWATRLVLLDLDRLDERSCHAERTADLSGVPTPDLGVVDPRA